MSYVVRSKTAKEKLRGLPLPRERQVTLTCGCETDAQPTISNPTRWFCCGAFRRARS